jgi:hypothetical protein
MLSVAFFNCYDDYRMMCVVMLSLVMLDVVAPQQVVNLTKFNTTFTMTPWACTIKLFTAVI